ncbi:MAG: hypothetical protein WB762_17795 [Candidatus Sulfotelmatobacter sp.]
MTSLNPHALVQLELSNQTRLLLLLLFVVDAVGAYRGGGDWMMRVGGTGMGGGASEG